MNKTASIGTLFFLLGYSPRLWAQAEPADTMGMEGFSFPLITVLVLVVLVLFLMLRELVNLRKRVDVLDKHQGNPTMPHISGESQSSNEELSLVRGQFNVLSDKQNTLAKGWEELLKAVQNQEQQLLDQSEINFSQRDKLEELEEKIKQLIIEAKEVEPSVAAMSEEDLKAYIKSAIDQHFHVLGIELERQLINKLNMALVNVPQMVPLELGKVYFVERPPRSGQFNHALFRDTWNMGKGVYKIVVDVEDADKAYLYINAQDTISYERAWRNYDQYIAPFFNLLNSSDDSITQAAVLKRKRDIWEVERKGTMKMA